MKLLHFHLAIGFACLFPGCAERDKTVQESPDEKSLGQAMIDLLPRAAESEVVTPEAAAQAMTEALLADDWNGIVRASTLRLKCERLTLESTVFDLHRSIPIRMGDPTSPMAQFVTRCSAHFDSLRELQFSLMGVDAHELRVLRSEELLDPEVMAEIRAQSIYRRPENLRFVRAMVDPDLSRKAGEQLLRRRPTRDLGVTDVAWVKVTIEGVPGKNILNEETGELQIDFVIQKIASNWLVEMWMLAE